MMKELFKIYFLLNYCLEFVTKIIWILFGKAAWNEKSEAFESSSNECKQNAIDWIRPLGYTERFMTSAGNLNNMTTLYALWMQSQQPVTIEHIKQVSHHISRKMPHLRICLDYHKNNLWWRRMSSDKLDIKEVNTDQDVLTIFDDLSNHTYNTKEGPLWFVRFVTSSNLHTDVNMNTDYKYVCVFGFHHNFSDGTTNMNFCNNFITLLNDHLQNKEPQLNEISYFASPIHDQLANSQRSNIQLLKYFAMRFYRGLLSCNKAVKNFIKLYPMPYHEKGKTLVLENGLDKITTERLRKRCKLEGVSINSAFTAAANIGMYQMMLQRDESIQETTFYTQHAVNMRRYWPKDKQKQAYGCHISMANVSVHTSRDDKDNFWEYARKIHRNVYQELNIDKQVLKLQPLSQKLWLVLIANSLMSKMRFPSANDSHYCVTNMGDISSTICDNSPIVNISKLVRSVTGHYMQALCQHTIQTFQGKLYYSLDYYTQKMSVDVARMYISSLMDILRTEIHKPN